MRRSCLALGLLAAGACDSSSDRHERPGTDATPTRNEGVAMGESPSCGAPGAAADGGSAHGFAASWGHQDVRLHVDELTCEGCAWQIREVLGKEPGVGAVVTSVPDKRVTVTIDTACTTPARVMSALAKVGYLGKELP